MDIKSSIEQARRFLSGKNVSEGVVCCSCGMTTATKTVAKAIKKTFTDFPALIVATDTESPMICDNCISLYDNKDMRFKIIFASDESGYKIPDRTEVLEIIANPPPKFVLSVPYSFKKHHWLYAGLSSNSIAYIGTDTRTVVIDYTQTKVGSIIETVKEYIAYGVPRGEIIAGKYSVFTMAKYPSITTAEEEIFSQVRDTGLIELIVKYTPAVKIKKIYEHDKEDDTMLTTAEKNAVNLLGLIASGSKYRADNGLSFWDGFFERRINRFKNLESHEFVSKLAEAVGTTHNSGYYNMIEELNEDELEQLMEVVRNKTHLIVSIVYSERKKD